MKKQGILFEASKPDVCYYEKRLAERGIKYIAGVDEVGRGCLAGPVMAAAVILPVACMIPGVTDSKQLSPSKREFFYDVIQREALAVGFGLVEPAEIDEINILQASLKAMRLAIESLSIKPEYLLIDGSHTVQIPIPQLAIPKGDYRSLSVGAASIMAKVKRDRLMCEIEKEHTGFSFSVHKGYGTALHMQEIRKNGPTKIHRLSFQGVVSSPSLRA